MNKELEHISLGNLLIRYTIIIVKRFILMCDDINRLGVNIPTVYEKQVLEKMILDLNKIESVNKTIQREDINMAEVRDLFDALLLEAYHTTVEEWLRKYISPNASIIKCPKFEDAVVKVINDSDRLLNREEEEILEPFKCKEMSNVIDISNEDTEMSFTEKILFKKKQHKKNKSISKYENIFTITPPSNVVERFFSSVKHIITPNRSSTSSLTLEMILFLKFNNELYNASDIDVIIKNSKEHI